MSIPEGKLYGDVDIAAGKIAFHHPSTYITTRVAAGAIIFGQALAKGASEDQVKTPAAGSDAFCGVAGWSTEATDFDDGAYAAADPVAQVEIGVVMVYVEEAVDVGDPVRIRHTASGEKAPGAFCTTADAGKTSLVTGAEFRGSTTGAGYVPLYVKGLFTTTPDPAG